MAQRNAVRVLPLPVGARISVDSPRAIAGQPSRCGGVGASNAARNHSATAGWQSSNTSPRFPTFTILSRLLFHAVSAPSCFRPPTSVLYPVEMGDSGEGLVDAEARIQERMEEREADRRRTSGQAPVVDPDKVREK